MPKPNGLQLVTRGGDGLKMATPVVVSGDDGTMSERQLERPHSLLSSPIPTAASGRMCAAECVGVWDL